MLQLVVRVLQVSTNCVTLTRLPMSFLFLFELYFCTSSSPSSCFLLVAFLNRLRCSSLHLDNFFHCPFFVSSLSIFFFSCFALTIAFAPFLLIAHNLPTWAHAVSNSAKRYSEFISFLLPFLCWPACKGWVAVGPFTLKLKNYANIFLSFYTFFLENKYFY